LELSDDSDIEVHPNVDKRSFIRAKQSQIHMERQQRKVQIEALKHNRVINDALMQRLSAVISVLKSRQDASAQSSPAEVTFRALMELAPRNSEEDTPPPPPEGVFDGDSPPLPTYSKMMARLFDEVNKSLDERRVEKDQRYEAFVEELGVHLQKIQDLQTDLAKNLDELDKPSSKITSESYHVGFDSSHVSKTKPDEKPTENTKPELLNPAYNSKQASSDATTNAVDDIRGDDDKTPRISPASKKFSQIKESDYRASHDFISSNPAILHESETDALLVEAYNALLDHNDEARAQQCVHQAVLLKFCRLLGQRGDGVALFFKRILIVGHPAREMFEKDVAETFQQIQGMAKRDAEKQQRIQLHPAGQNTASQIQVPPADSADEEVKKARTIFEGFGPEMRAALESGELDEVNKVLGGMDAGEAESLVGFLRKVIP
jgi:cell division cycle protein 37